MALGEPSVLMRAPTGGRKPAQPLGLDLSLPDRSRAGATGMPGAGAGTAAPPLPGPNPNPAPVTRPASPLPLPAAPAGPPGMSGLEQALNIFQGLFGPDQAANQAQRDRINSQIGQAIANRDVQGGFLDQSYQQQLALNALQQQGLGIDQAAAQRGVGNSDQLIALANQLFGAQNQSLDINLSQLGVQHGSDVRQNAAARRHQISSATSRGAMVTEGNRFALGDIAAQLGDINTSYGLGQQDIGNQRQQLGIGHEKELVGLKEQRAQAVDQTKQLDLKAKELGINKDQLRTSLQQGLANLGVGAYVDVNNLMDKLNSTDAQDRAIAEQIYRSALEYAGLFDQNPGVLGAATATPGKQGRI